MRSHSILHMFLRLLFNAAFPHPKHRRARRRVRKQHTWISPCR